MFKLTFVLLIVVKLTVVELILTLPEKSNDKVTEEKSKPETESSNEKSKEDKEKQ